MWRVFTGFWGASQRGCKRDHTHLLHASAFARMHAHASGPYLVCTDSNLNPGEPPAAEQAKSMEIAHDNFDEGSRAPRRSRSLRAGESTLA